MQKVRTPLFEQLVINYSIFGFAHNIAMVAAITNAGGYGVYGAMRRFPDEIREELALIRLRRSSSINSQPTPLALPAQQHPTPPLPQLHRKGLLLCRYYWFGGTSAVEHFRQQMLYRREASMRFNPHKFRVDC